MLQFPCDSRFERVDSSKSIGLGGGIKVFLIITKIARLSLGIKRLLFAFDPLPRPSWPPTKSASFNNSTHARCASTHPMYAFSTLHFHPFLDIYFFAVGMRMVSPRFRSHLPRNSISPLTSFLILFSFHPRVSCGAVVCIIPRARTCIMFCVFLRLQGSHAKRMERECVDFEFERIFGVDCTQQDVYQDTTAAAVSGCTKHIPIHGSHSHSHPHRHPPALTHFCTKTYTHSRFSLSLFSFVQFIPRTGIE